jgi:tRNA threonylcarbamoyladenosine biosynthesis protein TsaB
MLILGLDTATPWGTVALVQDEEVIFELTLKLGKGSGEYLLALLDRVLQKSGRRLAELNLIAVGDGPGSYTGIRIGLAAVSGIAAGLQLPVYGISTLRIIAANARYSVGSTGMVAVALDARRAEVYAALYQVVSGVWREEIAPQAMRAETFAARLADYGPVTLCGDGGKNYHPIFETAPGIVLAPPDWDRPRAGLAAEIARQEWSPQLTTNLGNLTPEYLRKTEAEIRLEEKLGVNQDRPNVCR